MSWTANWFKRKPELYVCAAGEADLPHLAQIHAGGFARPWSDGEISALARSKGAAIWIAVDTGRKNREICGFVLLRQAADEAEIITIATAGNWQRRGVGRALMEHAIRVLQHDRVGRLFLEVSEDNKAALALYRGLGFRRVGIRQSYYSGAETASGTSTAALVMERELG